MIKKLHYFVLALLCTSAAIATEQDIIKKENGIELTTKVVDMTYFTVAYKLYNNTDSTVYKIPKSEISKITFANGSVEEYNKTKIGETNNTTVPKDGVSLTNERLGNSSANTTLPKTEDIYTRESSNPTTTNTTLQTAENYTANNSRQMAEQGQKDASMYYKNYRVGAVGAGISSLLAGALMGLIPTSLIIASDIKDKNLGYPSKKLMENESYSRAYRDAAENTKKTATWTGYGIGVAARVITVIVVVLIAFSQI